MAEVTVTAVCRELQKSQKTRPREEARVEAGLGGQAGERGVADAGGQEVGGQNDARDQVAAQPLRAVLTQDAETWKI